MSRYTTKFSPEQKQAVTWAVLDDGLSAPAAARAARTGELPGVIQFTVNAGTVRRWVAAEQHERVLAELAEPGAMEAAANLGKRRATAYLLQETERLGAEYEKDGVLDAIQARRVWRALDEITRIENRPRPNPAPSPSNKDERAPDRTAEALVVIQQLLDSTQRAETSDENGKAASLTRESNGATRTRETGP